MVNRRYLLVGILSSFVFASCSHSSVQKDSSHTKLTPLANETEIYLGRPLPEKVSQESVSYLSHCFSKHDEAFAFLLKVSSSDFQIIEGKLKNISAITACLNSQKSFKWSSLEGHWIWASGFKTPKVVGKNWLRITPPATSIQQKSGKL